MVGCNQPTLLDNLHRQCRLRFLPAHTAPTAAGRCADWIKSHISSFLAITLTPPSHELLQNKNVLGLSGLIFKFYKLNENKVGQF